LTSGIGCPVAALEAVRQDVDMVNSVFAGTVMHTEIVDAAISVADLERVVADRRAGAVVSFVGAVRDHDHQRAVVDLEYQAHPSAGDALSQVAREVCGRHDVISVAVVHRCGKLAIGDAALVAVVSAAHRAPAFAACADLVEEVKARVPIWKHQLFEDGTDEWVNCP
jgi:molybdopterin synthase catalytic subunit